MNSELDSNGPPPLPVMRILQEGIYLPAKHAATLIRIVWPLVVLQVLNIVLTGWHEQQNPEDISGRWIAFSFFLGLVMFAASTLATVACHRVFILGDDSMKGQGPVWWSSRETWFVVYSITLALIIMMPLMVILPFVFSISPEEYGIWILVGIAPVGFLMTLLAAYCVGRWSLILPATAVDDEDRQRFAWAWSISTGNGLRLMVIIGLLPLGVSLVYPFLPNLNSIVYSILVEIAFLYFAAVQIAWLSLSYRELMQHQVVGTEDS